MTAEVLSTDEEMVIDHLTKNVDVEFELEDFQQIELGYEGRFMNCNSNDQWLAVSG
jgi:hypothetical protein